MLKVQLIKINPLMAKELANDALKAEEIAKDDELRKSVFSQGSLTHLRSGGGGWRRTIQKLAPKKKQEPNRPMETRVLENTIVKLGMLLMLGFGEAGVNIVARNMASDDQEWRD